MYRVVSPETNAWDEFICLHPYAVIYQQAHWAKLDQWQAGWDVDRVALMEGERIVAGAQILYYSDPLRMLSLAFLRMGPYVSAPDQWEPLWKAIDAQVKAHRSVFLRWRSDMYDPTQANLDLRQLGFTKLIRESQQTMIVPIGDSDEAMLKAMKRTTRYNVNQSQKRGVRYFEGTRDDVAQFVEVAQELSARKNFKNPKLAYFTKLYDTLVPDRGVFLMAEYEGKVVAGSIVSVLGRKAVLLSAAFSGEYPKLCVGYGIQWKALQWARSRGCAFYDLNGIPTGDPKVLEQQVTDKEPLAGVYFFKHGWGGALTNSLGIWDKVYNPLLYPLLLRVLRYKGVVQLRA